MSNGIQVPADAEYAMVGRITVEDRSEGPYVDITGTLDDVRQQPLIRIDELHHRDRPVFHALIPGEAEHKTLMGLPEHRRSNKRSPRSATVWMSTCPREGVDGLRRSCRSMQSTRRTPAMQFSDVRWPPIDEDGHDRRCGHRSNGSSEGGMGHDDTLATRSGHGPSDGTEGIESRPVQIGGWDHSEDRHRCDDTVRCGPLWLHDPRVNPLSGMRTASCIRDGRSVIGIVPNL